MNFCDDNPSVVAWASEPCKITYQNPLNGKVTAYVPDFVIVYMDKKGNKNAELVEIKPATQSNPEFAKEEQTGRQLYKTLLNGTRQLLGLRKEVCVFVFLTR